MGVAESSEPEELTESFKATVRCIYKELWISPDGEKLGEHILLKVEKPFVYGRMKNEYFIVYPRYSEEGSESLLETGGLTVNFYRISELQAKSDDPFKQSTVLGGERGWCGYGSISLDA